MQVAPHFLMELHLSLVCAVPNARWLEYIPQLDAITAAPIRMEDGMAHAPTAPGLGIAWDEGAIDAGSDGRIVVDRRDDGAAGAAP